jgi:hypothetical protein
VEEQGDMNPYFLETEMWRRQAELQQELERWRREADPLAGLFRIWRAGRRQNSGRPDVAASVEPGLA